MTYDDLAAALGRAAPETEIALLFDGAAPPAGLHITEIRRGQVDAIDCAGRRDGWEEVAVQVIFGGGGLTAGTAAGIFAKARAALDGVGAAPVRVEAAPSGPLSLYKIEAVETGPAKAVIRLRADRPLCKPAQGFAATKARARRA